jgi:hypothetical protein
MHATTYFSLIAFSLTFLWSIGESSSKLKIKIPQVKLTGHQAWHAASKTQPSPVGNHGNPTPDYDHQQHTPKATLNILMAERTKFSY